jgi:hypothetical protein
LFANFQRLYLLVDRTDLRILVDPYTIPGQVRFYVRKRLGGIVLNNDAGKQFGPRRYSMNSTLNFKFIVKSLDKGQLEGHGSTFGNVDLTFDIVRPGAFQKSLATHRANGTMPQFFWQHDPAQVAGKWLTCPKTRLVCT